MSTTSLCNTQLEIAARFRFVRRRTLALCEPLTPEDMMVQSSVEASPAKWHLAHTAWFFESFVLGAFLPGYRLFNPDFHWLFNSGCGLRSRALRWMRFCATGGMWTREWTAF
jgi:hypothetical protein